MSCHNIYFQNKNSVITFSFYVSRKKYFITVVRLAYWISNKSSGEKALNISFQVYTHIPGITPKYTTY